MIRNNFIIAIRSIRKHKFHSLLNAIGLSVGIASCLVIVIYIFNQFNYDTYVNNSANIYRVNTKTSVSGQESHYATSVFRIAEILKNEIAGVESATRIWKAEGRLNINQNIFAEDKLFYVDRNFFNVFNYEFLSGNAQSALDDPQSVILTSEFVKKSFADDDVLGKIISIKIYGEEKEYKVTGVLKSIPSNTHLRFEVLVPMPQYLIEYYVKKGWGSYFIYTYFLVSHGLDPSAIEKQLVLSRLESDDPQAIADYESYKASANYMLFPIQELGEIHLNPGLLIDLSTGINKNYLSVFGIIAVFLIFIASINYINLSTALVSKRTKEVGIRKMFGSSKLKLITQFLLEAIILSTMTSLITLGLVELSGFVAQSYGIEGFGTELFGRGNLLISVFSGSILVGLIAGIYPAFYLASLSPILALRKKNIFKLGKTNLRNYLVITQFSIASLLIISSIIIHNQIKFMSSKDLGFDKENVVIVKNKYNALGDQWDAFKQALLKETSVINASLSGYSIANSLNTAILKFPGKDQGQRIYWQGGDHDYVKTMGLEIVMGRDFSLDYTNDSIGIIINETAVEKLDLGKNPIGEKLQFFGRSGSEELEIIGVVKDFHFQSKLNEIASFGLLLSGRESQMAVRIAGGDVVNTLDRIETLWNKHSVNEPFDFIFFDQEYDRLYKSEMNLGVILKIFTALSLFVAGLGLFGLSSFIAESKRKEVGIRKVLGASITQILALFSKGFMIEVLIGLAIACPAAYLLVNGWLDNFAYRIDIVIWPFFLATIAIILLAWLTVSYHSIQAANTNPTEVLNEE